MYDDQRRILARLVRTAVRFNGVIVPASNLHTILTRYVDNLFVWNDHDIHKVSLVGSALRIKFLSHYFLLCTNHQLRNRELENVSVMSDDGKNVITSSGVRHFTDESNPNYLDLAAFEFTEPCRDHPELREGFFDLRSIPPNATNTDIAFVLIAGFPSKDQNYELEEKNHIGKFKRIVICEPGPTSYNPALLCVRTKVPFGFDPDGMSGGSAFVVQRIGHEFEAFLAGMVVTAGTDRFHIVKVGSIKRFLESVVDYAG